MSPIQPPSEVDDTGKPGTHRAILATMDERRKPQIMRRTMDRDELKTQLERMQRALDEIRAAVLADELEGCKPRRPAPPKSEYPKAPPFAAREDPPNYGKCRYCGAGILWESTPAGWRCYDPTDPWARHVCSRRKEQDGAEVMPPAPEKQLGPNEF